MDSSKHDFPGGEPYDDEQPAGSGTRRRWPLAAAVVIVALAAVAGGVAVAGNFRSADPAPAAASTAALPAPTASATVTTAPSSTVAASESATPSASATSSTSASATPAPSPGAWRTFTSTDSKVSFEYPASWRVSPAAGASASGGVNVDVANESAVVVASLRFGPSGGMGGACQGAVPYTVLDSAEVNLPYQPSKGSVTPRFAFRALQEADHVTASYGLTSTLAGQGGTTCMFYNVVNGPADPPLYSFADAFLVRVGDSEDDPTRKGAKTFASMDAARAYMQTPEYLNAKRMITSLKINEG